MHELSLCENLICQLESLVKKHGAVGVAAFELEVGRLSGAEPTLLRHAFSVASIGRVAEHAVFSTRVIEARILCADCGSESEVPPNRLSCPLCGSLDTRLVDGDALTLRRVELISRSEDTHV